MDAAVGEDGVGAGHVEGGGVVGAEGDGGGALGVGDAGGAGEGGDVAEADLLAEGDGRVVERVGEGVGGGDVAPVAGELVVRIVGFAAVVVGEGGFSVVEDGGGGEGLAGVSEDLAIDGGGVGGGVDPGLEDGAGRALGGGVVELRVGVVATADEGKDLAGVGVEGDEGDLGKRGGGAVELVDELVDVRHAEIDGVGSGVLEVGVEGGVDAERGVGLLLVGEALRELFVDEVDEVGRVGGVDVLGGEVEGLGLSGAGLGGGEVAGLLHDLEDEVAALGGALGVAVGVEAVGALDEAGEGGELGGVELLQVLAEEALGGLAEAIDGERAALAEVDLVGVHVEDLLLGEAGFELEGDEDL